MVFKCKVCSEKDKQIALLEKHLSFMTQLAMPPKSTHEVTFIDRERDAILSGAEQPLDINLTDHAEADAILTGMYDHVQVEVVD